MPAQAYAYGHLVTVAISAAIGMAFAFFAWRLPAYRRDMAYAVAAFFCAATSLASMLVALEPTLFRARLLFAAAVLLYLSVPVLWHVQFADVLDPAKAARHRRLILAYCAGGVLLLVLLMSGALDGHRARIIEIGQAESAVPAVHWAWALATFVFACAIIPLSARLLAADGPRRRERRSALPLMLFAPPLCAHELLVAAGVIKMVPLGGYLAGVASLQGVVILTERLRSLTEPRHLGPYRLGKKLGSGGMAEVFMAHRSGGGPLGRVHQQVAVKKLHPSMADNPDEARRFIEEARALGRLSHPHIVRLLDAGLQDGQLFLALELVDGASLARLIDHSAVGPPFSRAAVIEVAVQTASALACAHREGLIHRDVSPQNLLVDRHGTIKLGDFGIARSLDRTITSTGTVRGKLPYIAPEQLRGAPYDGRVDLWALGAVLHQLTSGAPPFVGESDAEIIYAIVEGRRQRAVVVRERVGEELANLIDRMLDTDPDRRVADPDEVVRLLEPLRDARAGTAELIDRVQRTRHVVAEQAGEGDLAATRRL